MLNKEQFYDFFPHTLIEDAEAEMHNVGDMNEVVDLNLDKYSQGEKR